MSEDEVFILFICFAVSLFGWFNWYRRLIYFWPSCLGKKNRIWLGVMPIICMFSMFTVLSSQASYDVVDSTVYIFFYIIFGMAWLILGRLIMTTLFDISWLDDAIERNNKSAVFVVSGSIIGLTAVYSGANIGDGPGWWCVLIAGGLATIVWFLLFGLLQIVCDISERITIERNTATGIRIAFYMVSSGIILGRGAAGDWTSTMDTIIELFDAWPVLILFGVAIFVEKWFMWQEKNGYENEHIYSSLFWGFTYLLLAIIILVLSPPLPTNPIYSFLL
ncbi:UNVERIFIED_CONTAM: hypothetical protein Cloal_0927 [Acetivibrio alkalicellulosi]